MPDSLRALIQKHLPTLRQQGQELIDALDRGDIAQAKSLSHSLKGASGSLGFRRYMELSHSIESQCKIKLKDDAQPIDPKDVQDFQCVITDLDVHDSTIY